MQQRHPMTKVGAELLEAELSRLKTVERPRIVKAIAEARAHGDLKENAEYHAAREQQSFTEGRIREIESKLAFAQVIDIRPLKNEGRVIFGATVCLRSIDNDDDVVYQIVGEDEADLKHAKISFSSPIARALIGKYEDDDVTVETPAGEVTYEIKKVEYF